MTRIGCLQEGRVALNQGPLSQHPQLRAGEGPDSSGGSWPWEERVPTRTRPAHYTPSHRC